MIKLQRWAYTKHGTFGTLYDEDSGFMCFTVERPWKDNEPNVSCIPCGAYAMKLSFFNKGNYPAYEIESVPGRTAILIHVANTMEDVIGCIGVGKDIAYINGLWAVRSSHVAYSEFMDSMGDRLFETISISNHQGGIL